MALGFYFDMTRCIGCRACQVACKDKNRLDVGTIYRTADSYEVGTFPKVKMYSFSTSCNHCQNPACVSAPATPLVISQGSTFASSLLSTRRSTPPFRWTSRASKGTYQSR